MKLVRRAAVKKFDVDQVYTDRWGKKHKVYRDKDGKLFEIHKCEQNNIEPGNGCGALLQITEQDVYEVVSGGYGGFDSYSNVFCCIRCGGENYMEHTYIGELNSPLKPRGRRPSQKKIRQREESFCAQ